MIQRILTRMMLLTTLICVWRFTNLTIISEVQAQSADNRPILFEENFEGDLSKWQLLRGSMSDWQIDNGKLRGYINTLFTVSELIPKSQFWDPSWQDFEYSVEITPIIGIDKNITLGVVDTGNWFEYHFVQSATNVVRILNGQPVFDDYIPYVMQNGQTYQITIKKIGTSLETWVDGTKIDERNHPGNPTVGSISIKIGTGIKKPAEIKFDNIVVRAITADTDQKLALTHFKQTDPSWAEQEYDHTAGWSDKPTMKRWGCLVTSLAMVLDYHDISQLPDGQALSPATLNNWLKSQPDGYIGNGLVNWMAVTRLTQLISNNLGTPKLEYQRINSAETSYAARDIRNGKPAILEINGHFLVGNGVTSQSDLYISDPAYTYEKFSEHRKSLKSTRLLTPSHTDLSYFLITHHPNTTISIIDSNGTQLATQTELETTITPFDPELMSEANDDEVIGGLALTTFAKPIDGTYSVTITSSVPNQYQTTVYAYDQQANVKNWPINGYTDQSGITFELDYQKNTGSSEINTFEPVMTLAAFSNYLRQLEQTQNLNASMAQRLLRISVAAEDQSPQQQARTVVLLKKHLSQYKRYFSAGYEKVAQHKLELLEKVLKSEMSAE